MSFAYIGVPIHNTIMSAFTVHAPRRMVGGGVLQTSTLCIRIDYTGTHDNRLNPTQYNRCAHVWDDTLQMPQLGEGFVPEEVEMWKVVPMADGAVVFKLSMPATARYVYVGVFENRAADSDGGSGQVAVPGERRAQAALELTPIRAGMRMSVKLELPEAEVALGTVSAWIEGAPPGAPAAMVPGAAMLAAYAKGDEMAARNTPLPGVPGLTLGMLSLDTRYLNDKDTHMPSWAWMINMPHKPETPAFVEGILRAAAELRGIPIAEMERLAAIAGQDVQHPLNPARPADETVTFAMLLAEAVWVAVTRAHYLTDAYDKNRPGDLTDEVKERMW